MEAGPRRMYEQQRPAYEARDLMASHKTDSTPETPPSHSEPDLEGLTTLKQQIVRNLPTNCCHCGADYFRECFVELRDGTIMAYCKTKGACGKSLVLFAGLDLAIPTYRKICPFQAAPKDDSSEQTIFTASTSLEVQEQAMTAVAEAPHEAEIDYYELHGITKPNVVCILCEKPYNAHERVPCDINGWVHSGERILTMPSDWPVYDPNTFSWTNME